MADDLKRLAALAAAWLLLLAAPSAGSAQTDYYNTDARRPVRIEDAFPVERYAFELQVAPLRLERSDEGIYQWEFEPELAYGLLPRTHLEIGIPLLVTDGEGGESEFGVGGIAVSMLHNLNLETAGLPAFGLAADVLVPVGRFAPDGVYPSVKAIATRTFGFARFHLNGQYTFGATPEPLDEVGEASRWMAGVAVDRTIPLRSALIIGDVYVEQPLHEGTDPVWTLEAGARYQLDPYFALDAGIGRRVTGEHRGWFVTFGAARAFAIRSLFPVPRR
jgi:hypothetical protein